MAKSDQALEGRRNFLKTAVASAVTLAAPAANAFAARPSEPSVDDASPPAIQAEVLTEGRSGSDFMVDVIKSLGFEYSCATAANTFRGLHESVINYGNNQNPEFITCCHEESSVAMAHGYAKIEGKPLLVFCHGTVGLQHAAMAIYNAYCDRVPVYIILGNTVDAAMRDPAEGQWIHSAQDPAAFVRDFVKWDDQPVSLQDFAESAVRAYKIAMTEPSGPVILAADSELQENPIPERAKLRIPKLAVPAPPQGDSGAVAEAARLLVQAQNPVIIVDRAARTQDGMKRIIELAETLQAPVIDKVGRLNLPTRHPLNQSARSKKLIAGADVILGLELADFWGTLNSFRDQVQRSSHPLFKTGVRLISITSGDLYIKANYQAFSRYTEVDLAIAADAEATLPSLVEAIKGEMTPDRKRTFQDRGAKLAEAHLQSVEEARDEATYAWDASPISTARLCAEVWGQIKDEDWSLVSDVRHLGWPMRLWTFDKYYQYIGYSGGGGVGYNAPATVGAALANRKHGRLSVSFQNDGDLLFAPAVLWTAAHHRIPLLSVMNNNRAYHEELMHIQRMACRHNRGIERAKIGVTFEDPNFDFAKIAQGMGVYAEGPITDPKDLGPAIKRAIAVVKRGEPALLDVVTQPR